MDKNLIIGLGLVAGALFLASKAGIQYAGAGGDPDFDNALQSGTIYQRDTRDPAIDPRVKGYPRSGTLAEEIAATEAGILNLQSRISTYRLMSNLAAHAVADQLEYEVQVLRYRIAYLRTLSV